MGHRPGCARRTRLALVGLLAVGLSACGTVPTVSTVGGRRQVRVVAAENFWGSVAAQIGGTHVAVTSIITNPDADPHSYEPTPADARRIASAQLVIVNGLGYDPWASRLVAADGAGQDLLDVGQVLHLPVDANPHRWYNPEDVRRVVAAIEAALARLDPADSAAFAAGASHFDQVALGSYHQLIAQIRRRYGGTPVGASESIFAMLAPALGLRLITPPAFLKAISEGTEVSAGDVSTIDRQIRRHQIAIYVVNTQNTTPDVTAQLSACRAAGIPVAAITETMTPASGTFQGWQVHQLQGILAALQRSGVPAR